MNWRPFSVLFLSLVFQMKEPRKNLKFIAETFDAEFEENLRKEIFVPFKMGQNVNIENRHFTFANVFLEKP